jgi:uncharacterized protein involved in exopolysaccharide biosynthesis
MAQPRKLTDKDVASAVDLMKNRDLLRDVVVATGMLKTVKPSFWSSVFGTPDEKSRRAELVDALERDIRVDAPATTDMIHVRYANSDPQIAADVLNALGRAYVQKYVEVNRATGTAEFYALETERARKELTAAHERLVDFSRKQGVVSAEDEKKTSLNKLADFVAGLQQTNAGVADVKIRIATIEKELQSQTADEASAQYLRAELAMKQVELAGLTARARSIEATVERYRRQLAQLGEKGVAQQQLLQQARQAEQNYVAALSREESAKASLAMEAEGITNVAIAEAATVPSARTWKPWKTLALGVLAALLLAVLVGFALEALDSTIRTPDQLRAALNVPILATLSQASEEEENGPGAAVFPEESWA